MKRHPVPLKNSLLCIGAVLVVTYFLSGCAARRPLETVASFQDENCVPATHLNTPVSWDEASRPDTLLQALFSTRSLRVAVSLGLIEDMQQLVAMQDEQHADEDIATRLDQLSLLSRLQAKLSLASLEVSAFSSVLDCEEERAEQLIHLLNSKEQQKITQLTVGAIIVGAAGAVVGGALFIAGSQAVEVIGIGTGLIEASLGVGILRAGKQATYHHPYNPLREIWQADAKGLGFPPPIWHYLNHNAQDEQSIRQRLCEHWAQFMDLKAKKRVDRNGLEQLYFGSGGVYSAEQLNNRASMIDQLEAQIKMMKQDLKLLAEELVRLQSR